MEQYSDNGIYGRNGANHTDAPGYLRPVTYPSVTIADFQTAMTKMDTTLTTTNDKMEAALFAINNTVACMEHSFDLRSALK